ncbi:hypothetical protein [Halostagnicola kamekurae]|uniref:Small CPxCG-related zinc finger protein n=1 Tax=Halostagnicola kamekurae TaxID=619731 RepID=A0A1I6RJW6_9EURY|nr:hypothetical protein [Halostagnicola kamekurae]SFS64992.1 hypothetical protein SAMN04488556_1846 [Halostagnicola kamekurae]
MSESERDSSAERSDSGTERETDHADTVDSSEDRSSADSGDDAAGAADASAADSNAANSTDDWESQTDLDPAESPFPQCPRCGRPVTRVTSTGPTDHTASPCGCRVSPNLLE